MFLSWFCMANVYYHDDHFYILNKNMNKGYVWWLIGTLLILWGCTTTNVPTVFDVDVASWTMFTGDSSEVDASLVPMASGSENIDINTGVTAEVKNMIQERQTQNQDDTKLTEEDIDLMEKIIEKVKNLGK